MATYRIRPDAEILATTAFGERGMLGVSFGRNPILVQDPPKEVLEDRHLIVEEVKAPEQGAVVYSWSDLVKPPAQDKPSSALDPTVEATARTKGKATAKGSGKARAKGKTKGTEPTA